MSSGWKAAGGRGVLFAIAAMLAVASPSAAQLPPAGAPPYITTAPEVVEAMIRMADVDEGDVVYDLGSGDGRIVIEAAKHGARGVGIEYEEWLVALSRANADSAGVGDRVHMVHGDVFEADLRCATVVMMYLGAEFNLRLRPRLLEQLAPGSRVVSHAFHMGDWQPDETRTIGSGASRATVFAWTIPADLDGFWSLQVEGGPARMLEIRQRFQEIEGEMATAAGRVRIEGRVEGDRLTIRTPEGGPLVFQGVLDGGRLQGTVSENGRTRRWAADRFGAAPAGSEPDRDAIRECR